MKIEIKSRWSGNVLFSVESESLKMALQIAVGQGADLEGAYLKGADLEGADLKGAYLEGAYLEGAYLKGADLEGADLKGAYLEGAYLEGAYLKGAYLKGADLEGADLEGADLEGADLEGADLEGEIPKIENIHQKIYEATCKENALDMSTWHTCETTHCRAGWAVTLAGEAGLELEKKIGTPAAAYLIYWKSDPKLKKAPDFYATDEAALEDMKKMAELEKASS